MRCVDVRRRELVAPELPGARRDDFLQRLVGVRALGDHGDVDAVGQRVGESGTEVVGELGTEHVDFGAAPSRSSTSTYSAIDSAPVGSARPKLILGRGVNPALCAVGQPDLAQRPLPDAGAVAVADEADLAELGGADPQLHDGSSRHG